jgi:AraC-like DNA-binding protein
MDAIAGLLDGARARGAFLLRSVMDPPWSIRIEDRAPLSLMAMVRGEAWVVPDDGPPVALHPGDIAVMRGPDEYTIADDPDTSPNIVIHPGQLCTTVDGTDLAQAMDLGVRTWGNNLSGSTVMLSGTYEGASAIGQRLLGAFPALLVLPRDTFDSPLIAYLADEIVKDEPGQEVVLDRLLDLLVIAAVRAWFSRPDAETPAWYRAHTDPVVGRALRMLHNNPAHAWTVAELATECGISRAGLARRFTDLVGEPPMTFLTGWRLALAADLLRETDATVGSVANQVGYGSPFALSTAFKRVHGISPRQHQLQSTRANAIS